MVKKSFVFVIIDLTVTLTSTTIIASSTIAPVTPPTCSNGGYFIDDICHCPSGYGGMFCEQKYGELSFCLLCLLLSFLRYTFM